MTPFHPLQFRFRVLVKAKQQCPRAEIVPQVLTGEFTAGVIQVRIDARNIGVGDTWDARRVCCISLGFGGCSWTDAVRFKLRN